MDEYGIKIDVNGQVTVQHVHENVINFIHEHVDENYELIKETLLGYPYVVIINHPKYWPQLEENLAASALIFAHIFGDAVILKLVKNEDKYEIIPLVEDEAYMIFAYCCRLRDIAEGSKLIDLTDIRYPYYNQMGGSI